MTIVFILLVWLWFADFTPRSDRSMEQIEAMRERLKEQNAHVIEARVEKEVEQQTKTREDHVQAEPITVRLWRGSDYHDRLASYAYRICQTTAQKKWVNLWDKYSCENQILTWNAENGWRNKFAKNTSNGNGTRDGGLCQLNSRYHGDFIASERYQNPLAQLEYCNWVWFDAYFKNRMPFYAYYQRHNRNRGITFK